MKKLISTIILLVIVILTANAQGRNSNNKVYNNIENNRGGCVKEFTVIDGSTTQVLKKAVYTYNTQGNLQGKIFYRWHNTQGWIGTQKYEYEYNNGKLENMIYTEWDKDIATWSAKSQHQIHIYGIEGELLAVKRIQVDNDHRLMANNETQLLTSNK